MNTTREIPRLKERLDNPSPLTAADFKAFDAFWNGKDFDIGIKIASLFELLGQSFKRHKHMEAIFEKIDKELASAVGFRLLKGGDIKIITEKIKELMLSDSYRLADDADKERVEDIHVYLRRIQGAMNQSTRVVPVQGITEPSIEESQIEEDDTTEADTQKAAPYSEPYEDTSNIDQKLQNAVLVSTYDEERFKDLYILLETEMNENKLDIAQKLLDAIQSAEELFTDKPFVQFATSKLIELSREMNSDQKILIFKRVRKIIERISDNRKANITEVMFKQSIYNKLYVAFDPFRK